MVRITSRNLKPCKSFDGCLREDRRVAGTYIHGFFDYPEICGKWLDMVGIDTGKIRLEQGPAQKEADYTLLKNHFEAHVDISALY